MTRIITKDSDNLAIRSALKAHYADEYLFLDLSDDRAEHNLILRWDRTRFS